MTTLTDRFSARPDLHQTRMYADTLRELGWEIDGDPGAQIFSRRLGPLCVAKYQRPAGIDPDRLHSFRRTHHTLVTYVEAALNVSYVEGIVVEPFAHSQSSLLDLKLSESALLLSFGQKTRYNITHTLKQQQLTIQSIPLGRLTLTQTADFYALHADWSTRRHVIGYPASLLHAVMTNFAGHGHLHLAYAKMALVGALLTLTHDRVATYYAAFATTEGYHLAAPTLLTWVSLQTAQSEKCDLYDFGGIYDPRYPKLYKRWPGFTKFKEGFRPTVISYPPTRLQLLW